MSPAGTELETVARFLASTADHARELYPHHHGNAELAADRAMPAEPGRWSWHLMLDIDDQDGPDWGRVRLLLHRAGFELVDHYAHRSRTGWHGWAMVSPEPTPTEAVALQAVCGSDPAREACNLARVRAMEAAGPWWAERFNVFYGLPTREGDRREKG